MISATRTEGGPPVVFLSGFAFKSVFIFSVSMTERVWDEREGGWDETYPHRFVREATRKYKAKVKGDTVFSANVSMISDPFASAITILLVRGCIY